MANTIVLVHCVNVNRGIWAFCESLRSMNFFCKARKVTNKSSWSQKEFHVDNRLISTCFLVDGIDAILLLWMITGLITNQYHCVQSILYAVKNRTYRFCALCVRTLDPMDFTRQNYRVSGKKMTACQQIGLTAYFERIECICTESGQITPLVRHYILTRILVVLPWPLHLLNLSSFYKKRQYSKAD